MAFQNAIHESKKQVYGMKNLDGGRRKGSEWWNDEEKLLLRERKKKVCN